MTDTPRKPLVIELEGEAPDPGAAPPVPEDEAPAMVRAVLAPPPSRLTRFAVHRQAVVLLEGLHRLNSRVAVETGCGTRQVTELDQAVLQLGHVFNKLGNDLCAIVAIAAR